MDPQAKLVILAHQDNPVNEDLLEIRAHLAPLVPRVIKVLLDHQEIQGNKETWDHRVQLEIKDHRVIQAHKVIQERQVNQDFKDPLGQVDRLACPVPLDKQDKLVDLDRLVRKEPRVHLE